MLFKEAVLQVFTRLIITFARNVTTLIVCSVHMVQSAVRNAPLVTIWIKKLAKIVQQLITQIVVLNVVGLMLSVRDAWISIICSKGNADCALMRFQGAKLV